MDVTKAPIIGTVYTKELTMKFSDNKEHVIPTTSYPVVAIMSAPNNKKSYVTNQWYKEYKRVPLVIHEDIVERYEEIKQQ